MPTGLQEPKKGGLEISLISNRLVVKFLPLLSFISIRLGSCEGLVSFAAARAGVTHRSPSPRGDGERCATPARAAAKETSEGRV